MSGFFESILSHIFDVETAPACAQDPCSVGAAPDLAGSGYSYSQEPEWHNNYGTAADYQVPAETFDSFSSVSDGGFSSCGGCGTDW